MFDNIDNDDFINANGTFEDSHINDVPDKKKKIVRRIRNIVVVVTFAIFVFFYIYGKMNM